MQQKSGHDDEAKGSAKASAGEQLTGNNGAGTVPSTESRVPFLIPLLNAGSCIATVLLAVFAFNQTQSSFQQSQISAEQAQIATEQAEAAKLQVQLSEEALKAVQARASVAKEQLDIFQAEIASRRENAGFQAFALESGHLRIVAYNVGAEFVLQGVTLLPVIVHSGSASPRPGIPVQADFEIIGAENGTLAYIVNDYVSQICVWQNLQDPCDLNVIADADIKLTLDTFEREISITGRLEVN